MNSKSAAPARKSPSPLNKAAYPDGYAEGIGSRCDVHMAAVAFYYVTDGSEAVAMVFFIGLGGEKSGFGFRQFPGSAVFHLDAERFPGVAGLEGNAAASL